MLTHISPPRQTTGRTSLSSLPTPWLEAGHNPVIHEVNRLALGMNHHLCFLRQPLAQNGTDCLGLFGGCGSLKLTYPVSQGIPSMFHLALRKVSPHHILSLPITLPQHHLQHNNQATLSCTSQNDP